jgi:hypothetical protein
MLNMIDKSDQQSKLSTGGLISESFSLWLQCPKKVPNHSPEQFSPKRSAQGSDLALFFGD